MQHANGMHVLRSGLLGGGGSGLPDLGSLMGAALQLIMGFASGGGGVQFHLSLYLQ